MIIFIMRGRNSPADRERRVLAFVELKFTDYVNNIPGASSQSVLSDFDTHGSPQSGQTQLWCAEVTRKLKITYFIFFQKNYK